LAIVLAADAHEKINTLRVDQRLLHLTDYIMMRQATGSNEEASFPK
jgi:hypothetical protein